MKRIALAAALLLSASALSGCASGPPETLLMASPTSESSWEPAQRGYLAWSSTRRGWTIAPSGLQYKRVSRAKPNAPRATIMDTVRVHYTGTLINGQVFDSSYERGEPIEFGLGQVIRGWTEGVALMHVGETYDFVIPADLAYGPRAMGSDIPANSTLLFRVELLAVNP